MNASRGLFKCGYAIYSRDLFATSTASRILFNCTIDRKSSWSCSMKPNQRITYLPQLNSFKQISVNNSLVTYNNRYFNTSIAYNNQAALKEKSLDHGNDDKKQKKPTEKSTINVDNNVENQSKTESVTSTTDYTNETAPEIEQKQTLTAKFKKMYKEYWYVLLPVHVVTSCFWFTSFYYISTSGVDIPAFLESMHFSETVINKLRDSSLGHAAIAYLCYKIATPLRYTVTLGGTTLSIKYLSQWGYIRPVPTKEQIKQMYDDQKAKFKKE